VPEAGSGARLAEEAPELVVGSVPARDEELQGHDAIELGVVGLKNDADATSAELTAHDVAPDARPGLDARSIGDGARSFVPGLRGRLVHEQDSSGAPGSMPRPDDTNYGLDASLLATLGSKCVPDRRFLARSSTGKGWLGTERGRFGTERGPPASGSERRSRESTRPRTGRSQITSVSGRCRTISSRLGFNSAGIVSERDDPTIVKDRLTGD
jgi:hypothetical protein